VSKVPPYHSSNPEDPQVYHDHDGCYEGQKIKPGNKVPGAVGRKCEVCDKLG
jgi:hypothetical protein